MIRDWHALRLVRRGHRVHLTTDPACVLYTPPRPGSRLDRLSRGVSCPRCAPPPPATPTSGGQRQVALLAGMSPHLAPALRTAAAEHRRDPDLMTAAAARIDSDRDVIERLVIALAREYGTTETDIRNRFGIRPEETR